MLQRDKEGRFAPGGHVTSGGFSGTVISVLNKVKGGSGAGLRPAPAPAPNPMLLGWLAGVWRHWRETWTGCWLALVAALLLVALAAATGSN